MYAVGISKSSSEYIQDTSISCAFVPQTLFLKASWQLVFGLSYLRRYSTKIHFAHRTFVWKSEARGSAHVHVVIVGFGLTDPKSKAKAIAQHFRTVSGANFVHRYCRGVLGFELLGSFVA